jgi:GAF domain-containing protein
MLVLGTFTPHQYTEEEKDSLIVAADRVAIAIENAELAGEVGRDREQFELMAAINRDVGSRDGIGSVYDSFITHASGLIDFDQASLALWNPEANEVEIVVMKTEASRLNGRGPASGCSAGRQVIASRRPRSARSWATNIRPTSFGPGRVHSAVYFRSCRGDVLVP